VIISGDDKTNEILGYSDELAFAGNKIYGDRSALLKKLKKPLQNV
jgi:hypothetical protein